MVAVVVVGVGRDEGSWAVCRYVGGDEDTDDGKGRLYIDHACDDILRVRTAVVATVRDGACQHLCIARRLPRLSRARTPLTCKIKSIIKSSSLRPKAKSSICVALFSLNLLMVLAACLYNWLTISSLVLLFLAPLSFLYAAVSIFGFNSISMTSRRRSRHLRTVDAYTFSLPKVRPLMRATRA